MNHTPFYLRIYKKKYNNVLRIHLNNTAVSNYVGISKFYYKKDPNSIDDDSSTLNINKNNITGKNFTQVKTIKLSEYINNYNSIDILKMDIEGAEYDVLEELIDSGAIHKIKYIFYECHAHKVPLEIQKKEI